MAEFSLRMSPSSSAMAKRRRADHALDSAKITRFPAFSTAPVTLIASAAGSLLLNQIRHSNWLCLCSATRASAECDERLNKVFTDSVVREIPTGRSPIRVESLLCRRIRFGILQRADRGKPIRKVGTQSHRSTADEAMTAGLPARRKVFETEQGAHARLFNVHALATLIAKHVLPEWAA